MRQKCDKQYKKAHLGKAMKANPFEVTSHVRGAALKNVEFGAKQPNPVIRQCVRVQLIKNGKHITAVVPSDACLNFIEENVKFWLLGLVKRSCCWWHSWSLL